MSLQWRRLGDKGITAQSTGTWQRHNDQVGEKKTFWLEEESMNFLHLHVSCVLLASVIFWVLPNGSVRIETLGFHSIAKVQKQQDEQARTLWDCLKKTTTVIIVTVKKLIHKWINVSYNVVWWRCYQYFVQLLLHECRLPFIRVFILIFFVIFFWFLQRKTTLNTSLWTCYRASPYILILMESHPCMEGVASFFLHFTNIIVAGGRRDFLTNKLPS